MARTAGAPWTTLAVVLGGVAASVLSGCGHPATHEECREIFDRSAAIELWSQKVTDPEVIRHRTEEAWAAKGEELAALCVGRRITDRAMACVRQAKTAEELDECLY